MAVTSRPALDVGAGRSQVDRNDDIWRSRPSRSSDTDSRVPMISCWRRAWRSATLSMRRWPTLDDQVALADAGGPRAGEPRTTSTTSMHPLATPEPFVRVPAAPGRAGDAEVARGEPRPCVIRAPMMPPRGGVDRHREAEPHTRDRSVHADHGAARWASAPPELPGLSAASVWITSSMRRTTPPAPVGSERPSAETTPGRHRAREPVRVSDRDDQLPGAQLGGVAERGRSEVALVAAQHGKIGEGVGRRRRRTPSRRRR